jgi:hypothetical protein
MLRSKSIPVHPTFPLMGHSLSLSSKNSTNLRNSMMSFYWMTKMNSSCSCLKNSMSLTPNLYSSLMTKNSLSSTTSSMKNSGSRRKNLMKNYENLKRKKSWKNLMNQHRRDIHRFRDNSRYNASTSHQSRKTRALTSSSCQSGLRLRWETATSYLPLPYSIRSHHIMSRKHQFC